MMLHYSDMESLEGVIDKRKKSDLNVRVQVTLRVIMLKVLNAQPPPLESLRERESPIEGELED